MVARREDKEVCIVKIGIDEIRAYYAQSIRKQPEYQADESKKVVLRMPVDSVDVSSAARVLQKGYLRVRTDDDGAYTRVTESNSSPLMKLAETAMRDVKKSLDAMKEITTVMEDEEIPPEERYAMQIRLVELEGELEKTIDKVKREYLKLTNPDAADKKPVWSIVDRASGESFSFNRYDSYIDKKTRLRVEAIERVRMRELDPEAFEEHIAKYRAIYADEFAVKYEAGELFGTAPLEMKALEVEAERLEESFPEEKASDFEPGAVYGNVDPEELRRYNESRDWSQVEGTFYVFPEAPEIDVDEYEIAMTKYVEEKLAQLEKDDYEAFNAMRVSVMSAKLAKESGAFLDNLTGKLTRQFEQFAAVNELVGTGEGVDPTSPDGEERARQISMIVRSVMEFIDKTILDGLQKTAVREAASNFTITRSGESNLSPLFLPADPVPMTWAEVWETYGSRLLGDEASGTE